MVGLGAATLSLLELTWAGAQAASGAACLLAPVLPAGQSAAALPANGRGPSPGVSPGPPLDPALRALRSAAPAQVDDAWAESVSPGCGGLAGLRTNMLEAQKQETDAKTHKAIEDALIDAGAHLGARMGGWAGRCCILRCLLAATEEAWVGRWLGGGCVGWGGWSAGGAPVRPAAGQGRCAGTRGGSGGGLCMHAAQGAPAPDPLAHPPLAPTTSAATTTANPTPLAVANAVDCPVPESLVLQLGQQMYQVRCAARTAAGAAGGGAAAARSSRTGCPFQCQHPHACCRPCACCQSFACFAAALGSAQHAFAATH